jgi:hypothetical protein
MVMNQTKLNQICGSWTEPKPLSSKTSLFYKIGSVQFRTGSKPVYNKNWLFI